MFYESKPLKGEPDKNVNGYVLKGTGSVYGDYDEEYIDKILEYINSRKEDFEQKIETEYKTIKTLQSQGDNKSLEKIVNIEKNSIPGYKRVVAFIDEYLIPYYSNLENLEYFKKNVKDDNDLLKLIEYYVDDKKIDITEFDTIGFEFRTLLDTIILEKPKLVRQNDPIKNAAGAINEALFRQNVLNMDGKIQREPYFDRNLKFEHHDVKTNTGDLYEIKSVFKIKEDDTKYSKYIFYIPLDKMEELEKYKRDNPKNTVRVYWSTFEDKPSTVIKKAKGITKDEYMNNQYYIDVKDKDTIDNAYFVEAYTKPNVNQDSYQLLEYNIDKYNNDTSKFVKKEVPLDALQEFYKLKSSAKELPDFMLLSNEEKQYYLRERLNGGNPHFILLDIFYPEKNYRVILDERFKQQNKKITKKATKKKMSKKKR